MGAFGVIVLVLIAWAPTPAFRSVVPALILIGLLAAGVEALRRQTVREFPDADAGQSTERLRKRVAGLFRRAGAEPRAGLTRASINSNDSVRCATAVFSTPPSTRPKRPGSSPKRQDRHD